MGVVWHTTSIALRGLMVFVLAWHTFLLAHLLTHFLTPSLPVLLLLLLLLKLFVRLFVCSTASFADKPPTPPPRRRRLLTAALRPHFLSRPKPAQANDSAAAAAAARKSIDQVTMADVEAIIRRGRSFVDGPMIAQIERDLDRTFSGSRTAISEVGPGQDKLRRVLLAFSVHNKATGCVLYCMDWY